MFDLKEFNQANVDDMIEHIDQMPHERKMQVTVNIRDDLKCFILKHFLVAEPFQKAFKQTPDSVWKEIGFAAALALEEKDWNLKVDMPTDDPPPPEGKCGGAKDEVDIGYDDGFNASKTVSWNWGSSG